MQTDRYGGYCGENPITKCAEEYINSSEDCDSCKLQNFCKKTTLIEATFLTGKVMVLDEEDDSI